LNSQAIKAKLTGELEQEDFDALKVNIAEETKQIETALTALESERRTLEQMSKQAKLQKIRMLSARESCRMRSSRTSPCFSTISGNRLRGTQDLQNTGRAMTAM
jgi:hypothetical protein